MASVRKRASAGGARKEASTPPKGTAVAVSPAESIVAAMWALSVEGLGPDRDAAEFAIEAGQVLEALLDVIRKRDMLALKERSGPREWARRYLTRAKLRERPVRPDQAQVVAELLAIVRWGVDVATPHEKEKAARAARGLETKPLEEVIAARLFMQLTLDGASLRRPAPRVEDGQAVWMRIAAALTDARERGKRLDLQVKAALVAWGMKPKDAQNAIDLLAREN